MNDGTPHTSTLDGDIAAILSVRDLEVAAVARILPRIRAAYAARMKSDRYALSPGAAAEEARDVTSAAAIRAEPDPAVRAELEAVRADLARVDAVYWQVVAGWKSSAAGVAKEGRRKMARVGIVTAEVDDLRQSAMIGLWRGILRWQPNAGAGPRGFCYDWSRAHTQGATAKGDLCGHGKRGWAIPGRARANRADAPIVPEGGLKAGKRTLLIDTLAAPDDDARADEEDARARVAALMAAASPRQRAAMEAYMREGGTLKTAGEAVGVSRERARQILLQVRDGRAPVTDHGPVTVADRILAHLAAHPAPMTATALSVAIGADPSAIRKSLQGLREGGQIRRIDAYPAPLYTREDAPMIAASPIDALLRDTASYLRADPPLPYSEIAARVGAGVQAVERAAVIARACGMTGDIPHHQGARVVQILADHPGADAADIARRARLRADDTAHTLRALILAGHVRIEGSRYFAITLEKPPMTAADPAPAPTLTLDEIAEDLGLDDIPGDPAAARALLRDLSNRPAPPDPRVAQLERQIADLRGDLDDYCKTITKIDEKLVSAQREARSNGELLQIEREASAQYLRDLEGAEKRIADLRAEIATAEAEIVRWRTAFEMTASASELAAIPPLLTADDLERRIALWVKAAETESLATLAADLPGLLPGEAEVLRDHRLAVAAGLRASALRGE